MSHSQPDGANDGPDYLEANCRVLSDLAKLGVWFRLKDHEPDQTSPGEEK